jgi:hypothetical protein
MCREVQRRKQHERRQMRPNLRRSTDELRPLRAIARVHITGWYHTTFFGDFLSRDGSRKAREARYPKFPSFREWKMQRVQSGSHILRRLMQIGRAGRRNRAQARSIIRTKPTLNQTQIGDTKPRRGEKAPAKFAGETQDETIRFRHVPTGHRGCCRRCRIDIIGNLQGTAGGGKIDVLVEAPGFAANLMMRTSGNRQTVQISSKGDIGGVSIAMVKS